MSYVADTAELKAIMPPSKITEALDDDKDGEADAEAFAAVAGYVDNLIDGALGQRYTLPLATVPPLVTAVALTLFAEALYLRAGFSGDQNPFAKRAEDARAKLERIAAGDEDLTFDAEPGDGTGGQEFVETLKTRPTNGEILL
jgi:phage gp36-like protein